jgi:hypothetical protein
MDFRLGLFSRLLVAILAIIHDLADRRTLRRSHFDQVKALIAGHRQGFGGRDDPNLFASGANQSDRRNPDLLIDAGAALPISVAAALWIFSDVWWDGRSPLNENYKDPLAGQKPCQIRVYAQYRSTDRTSTVAGQFFRRRWQRLF